MEEELAAPLSCCVFSVLLAALLSHRSVSDTKASLRSGPFSGVTSFGLSNDALQCHLRVFAFQ